MLSNLRILHPPSSDNPTDLPLVLLSVGSQRYLFNVPEGSTRSLIQQGQRGVGRGLSNIFLPRVGVQECGGLPGLIMSLADQGRSDVTIHGPPVLTHWLATCRPYLRRDNIKVQVKEAPLQLSSNSRSNPKGKQRDDATFYEDQSVTVKALPLLPKGFSPPVAIEGETGKRPTKRPRSGSPNGSTKPTIQPQACIEAMFPDDAKQVEPEFDEFKQAERANVDAELRRKLMARASRLWQRLEMPPPMTKQVGNRKSKEQAPVLVYIVRGPTIRGRFDVEKARSLGVKPGKSMGILSNGQDIDVQRPQSWASWDEPKRKAWLSRKPSQKQTKTSGKPTSEAASSSLRTPAAEEPLETVRIKGSDLVAAPQPGFVFIQIYIPSIDYLDTFLDQSTQQDLQFAPDDQPHVILHSVHHDVLSDHRYQAFISRFKTTHHIILSRAFLPDRLVFPSSALATLRMSILDEDMFKPPLYTLEPARKLSEVGLDVSNVHLTGLDVNVSLHPRGPPTPFDETRLELDCELDADKAKRLVSFEDIPGRKLVTEEDKAARQKAWLAYVKRAKAVSLDSEMVGANGHAASDKPLELTTLGTGSAMPSKYRNVSSTLLQLPGQDAGYILLDAGESTYAQLRRKYADQVDDILRNLRLLFLSHVHGDHHMGTTRLLAEREKLNPSQPLYIVAPVLVRRYLQEVHHVQSLGLADGEESDGDGVYFIDCEHLESSKGIVVDHIAHPEAAAAASRRSASPVDDFNDGEPAARLAQKQRASQLRERLVQHLGDVQVYTAEVDHRARHCYGIVLRGKQWSGAYSGDTRPCLNLIKAGKGVDFLLHEATIEDSKPEMADMKGHSTFGQAVDVAKQMGVKYVMLTHFSQRYPKLPKLQAQEDLGDLKVGMAFDLLTVKLSDLEKLMRYQEPLELLFELDKEDVEADEDGLGEDGKAAADKKKTKSPKEAKQNGQSQGNVRAASPSLMDVEKGDDILADDGRTQAELVNGEKEFHEKRVFQRKFVKSHEHLYISFDLRPIQRGQKIADIGIPSRLSIGSSLEDALVDLNGAINGSFRWDLLHVEPRHEKNFIRVLVKFPSEHVDVMRATISSGLTVEHSNATFQARYDRTFSSLDLFALDLDNSQDWFESLIRQRETGNGGDRAGSSS